MSLSFYESQLHKEGLRRRGCRDIRIVCDPDGYEMCLSERRSSRVGAEYRLSLAALRKGVFHPKVAVLIGDEETLILTGSGNLTFGGFGRNVEVLDVLSSRTHPDAFLDFHGFLSALRQRDGLSLTDDHWPAEWMARLEPYGAVTAVPSVRILHNLEQPLGQQVTNLVAACGGAVEIRCLSPFHDSDAGGVIKLAEGCGARRLVMGHLAGSKDCAFPFQTHRSTSLEVLAAAVTGVFGARPLHAKWWEIDCHDGTTLLVTGSMNATSQSMHTRNNVELVTALSVQPDLEHLLEWIPAEPLETSARETVRGAGLGKRAFAQAKLTRDGAVQGTLVMADLSAGQWQGLLEDTGGVMWQGLVDVGADGSFAFRVEDSAPFLYRLGVQLRLLRESVEARGWLEVEVLLEMTRRNLLSVTTTARILSGHAGHDEMAELLNYLALHAEAHLEEFSTLGQHAQRKLRSESCDDNATTEKPVSLLSLQKRDSLEAQSPQAQEDQEAHAMLAHVLARIRQKLLAGQRNSDGGGSAPIDDDGSQEDDIRDRARKEKRLAGARDSFNRELEALAGRLKEQVPTVRQLKVMGSEGPKARDRALRKLGATHALWFEGNLCALGDRVDEWESAETFLRGWFSSVAANLDHRTAGEATDLHMVETALWFASSLASGKEDAGMRRWRLSTLRSTLEIFFLIDAAAMESLAHDLAERTEPSLFLDRLLPPEARLALPETLRALLAEPSLDDQIKCLGPSNGGNLDNLPVFQSKIGMALKTTLETGRHPRIVRSRPAPQTCAHCNMKLKPETMHQLHRDQAARCTDHNCGAFLVAPF